MQTAVLITGANGFLARAVVEQLPASWQAIALVRAGTRCKSDRYQASFDSVDSLASTIASPTVVLHLAANIPADHNAYCPRLTSVNTDLPSRLTKMYPDARHVYASSVAVFGTPRSLPLTVDSPSIEPSRYGLSKLAGECVIRQLQSHAVIRYSSLIGHGMKPGSFISSAIDGARTNLIRLRGNGHREQNYVDIRDAAKMCIAAATSADCFVTLGIGDRSCSNLQIANMLANQTGAVIMHEGDDPSPSWIYDLNGAIDLLPRRTTIEDTLTGMLNT